MTSGTLAYAVGLGKPIVSTPYVQARKLLASGLGRLVGFGDSAGFSSAINSLFADPNSLLAWCRRTYTLGRTMIWSRLAEASLARFEDVVGTTISLPLPIGPPLFPKRPGTSALQRMETVLTIGMGDTNKIQVSAKRGSDGIYNCPVG
ncbi:hypothetical protein [Sphingopyxis sp.]|uniref:hypothetical protein n=1 Tax=Sphingopyxis sp. TaxID=1908224 RepID=UPI001D657678|nr:hypothetical protein [Sphingopyxis sp.]MBW8294470.1 hypothetical protein [Sphingopyxis sp.]